MILRKNDHRLQLGCVSALVFLLFAAVGAAENDPGVRDTIELVVTASPDRILGQRNIELELRVFNDSTILGATAGFSWDYPNLQLDSAKPSVLTSFGFDGGTFLYRANDVDSSNAAHQFIFGGFAIAGGGVPPSSEMQLWATYYFSLSEWTDGDSIMVDSTQVPPVSYILFVVPDSMSWRGKQRPFVPFFKGADEIRDGSDDRSPGQPQVPQTYYLGQNYPNPFNSATSIDFGLPVASHVKLTVHNVLGQIVRILIDKEMSAGRYAVIWNGTTDSGTLAASGVYMYKLQAPDYVETRKMILLK